MKLLVGLTVIIFLLQSSTGQHEDYFLLNIGEICDSNNSTCAPTLECIYETCSCRSGFDWDESRSLCVGKVGTDCESDSDCGTNSTCLNLFCACSEGYSTTKSHHCALSFGKPCQTESDCNVDLMLTCTADKYCRCKEENRHYFEWVTGFCGGRAGQSCDPYVDFYGFPTGKTGRKCYSEAKCELENEQEKSYSCKCPSGTYVNDDNMCAKAGAYRDGPIAGSIIIIFLVANVMTKLI